MQAQQGSIPEPEPSRPLAGLRVISMAEQYPGPYATMVMSDLGADVVMVERPGTGDPGRQFQAFFGALNRGKRSVALDLKSSDGLAALKQLVSTADIFLEGFRPGTAARLGIGWEDLRSVNPALVYVSISGFGQDGPYRLRPAHDLSYQASAGLLEQAEVPWRLADPLAIADLSSGLFALVGTLSALRRRDLTGVGTYIDVAMMDSLVSLMSTNIHPVANGLDNPWIEDEPGYGLYETKDGRITLSLSYEDWFWRSACEAMGLDDLTDLTAEERRADQETVRARIQERLRIQTSGHWSRVFTEADVPFAVVASAADVVRDPQVVARGLITSGEETGGLRHVRQPLLFDGQACGPRSGAPDLGADTGAVLSEAGLDRAVIDRLVQLAGDNDSKGINT